MDDYPITVQRTCSSCQKEFSTVTTLTGADKYAEVDAMMKEDNPKCDECGEPSLIIYDGSFNLGEMNIAELIKPGRIQMKPRGLGASFEIVTRNSCPSDKIYFLNTKYLEYQPDSPYTYNGRMVAVLTGLGRNQNDR